MVWLCGCATTHRPPVFSTWNWETDQHPAPSMWVSNKETGSSHKLRTVRVGFQEEPEGLSLVGKALELAVA